MIGARNRDYYAGAVVAFIGVGASVVAFRYNIGSLTKMGPGFFPFYLGILLATLGAIIAFTNFSNAAKGVAPEVDHHGSLQTEPDWRGWGCIVASVLSFIFLANYAGLLASTFCCVFIACYGDKTAKLRDSALLAAGISAFGIVLFSYVLKVQIPIVRGF